MLAGFAPRLLALSEKCPPAMQQRDHWSIKDFVLYKSVGSGAASAVFYAVCRKSTLPVAIKVYLKAKLSRLNRRQVEREINIHSSLNHPHIVDFYAAFEDDARLYLVMEFAAGGDLFDEVKRRGGRIPEAEVVSSVLFPYLSALEYLHARSVIHRDIKPENTVYCCTLNKEKVMKVTDFGLACDCQEERPVTRLGTLDYMAPEVLRCPDKHHPDDNKGMSELQYDASVDAWAMGVLAFELVVGRPPFGMSCREATMKAITMSAPSIPDWMSPGAANFINGALHKDPRQRSTVAQLIRHPWILAYTRSRKAGDLRSSLLGGSLPHQQQQLLTSPSLGTGFGSTVGGDRNVAAAAALILSSGGGGGGRVNALINGAAATAAISNGANGHSRSQYYNPEVPPHKRTMQRSNSAFVEAAPIGPNLDGSSGHLAAPGKATHDTTYWHTHGSGFTHDPLSHASMHLASASPMPLPSSAGVHNLGDRFLSSQGTTSATSMASLLDGMGQVSSVGGGGHRQPQQQYPFDSRNRHHYHHALHRLRNTSQAQLQPQPLHSQQPAYSQPQQLLQELPAPHDQQQPPTHGQATTLPWPQQHLPQHQYQNRSSPQQLYNSTPELLQMSQQQLQALQVPVFGADDAMQGVQEPQAASYPPVRHNAPTSTGGESSGGFNEDVPPIAADSAVASVYYRQHLEDLKLMWEEGGGPRPSPARQHLSRSFSSRGPTKRRTPDTSSHDLPTLCTGGPRELQAMPQTSPGGSTHTSGSQLTYSPWTGSGGMIAGLHEARDSGGSSGYVTCNSPRGSAAAAAAAAAVSSLGFHHRGSSGGAGVGAGTNTSPTQQQSGGGCGMQQPQRLTLGQMSAPSRLSKVKRIAQESVDGAGTGSPTCLGGADWLSSFDSSLAGGLASTSHSFNYESRSATELQRPSTSHTLPVGSSASFSHAPTALQQLQHALQKQQRHEQERRMRHGLSADMLGSLGQDAGYSRLSGRSNNGGSISTNSESQAAYAAALHALPTNLSTVTSNNGSFSHNLGSTGGSSGRLAGLHQLNGRPPGSGGSVGNLGSLLGFSPQHLQQLAGHNGGATGSNSDSRCGPPSMGGSETSFTHDAFADFLVTTNHNDAPPRSHALASPVASVAATPFALTPQGSLNMAAFVEDAHAHGYPPHGASVQSNGGSASAFVRGDVAIGDDTTMHDSGNESCSYSPFLLSPASNRVSPPVAQRQAPIWAQQAHPSGQQLDGGDGNATMPTHLRQGSGGGVVSRNGSLGGADEHAVTSYGGSLSSPGFGHLQQRQHHLNPPAFIPRRARDESDRNQMMASSGLPAPVNGVLQAQHAGTAPPGLLQHWQPRSELSGPYPGSAPQQGLAGAADEVLAAFAILQEQQRHSQQQQSASSGPAPACSVQQLQQHAVAQQLLVQEQQQCQHQHSQHVYQQHKQQQQQPSFQFQKQVMPAVQLGSSNLLSTPPDATGVFLTGTNSVLNGGYNHGNGPQHGQHWQGSGGGSNGNGMFLAGASMANGSSAGGNNMSGSVRGSAGHHVGRARSMVQRSSRSMAPPGLPHPMPSASNLASVCSVNGGSFSTGHSAGSLANLCHPTDLQALQGQQPPHVQHAAQQYNMFSAGGTMAAVLEKQGHEPQPVMPIRSSGSFPGNSTASYQTPGPQTDLYSTTTPASASQAMDTSFARPPGFAGPLPTLRISGGSRQTLPSPLGLRCSTSRNGSSNDSANSNSLLPQMSPTREVLQEVSQQQEQG